jgi:hypothetical protein
MYLKMKTKLLRVCERCLFVLGWTIMYGMAAFVLGAVCFAFWHLFTDMPGY